MQNLAGVNGQQSIRLHLSSVIIHDFYVKRILALPAEANPPLVINPDAVLAFAVTFQRFQVVAVGHAQVVQSPGLMQQQKLSPGRPLNLRRQAPGRLVVEQPLSFPAGKAAYHLARV
jgi:hypothetical protein